MIALLSILITFLNATSSRNPCHDAYTYNRDLSQAEYEDELQSSFRLKGLNSNCNQHRCKQAEMCVLLQSSFAWGQGGWNSCLIVILSWREADRGCENDNATARFIY